MRANVTVLATEAVWPPDPVTAPGAARSALCETHLEALRAVATRRGAQVTSKGSGITAIFTDRVAALGCAEAIEQAVSRLRRRDEAVPAVGIGMSCGEATSVDGGWSGTPIIEAERLCAHAAAGQVLATAVLAMLAGRRTGYSFVASGERVLDESDGPVAVVEMGWRDTPEAPIPLPPAARQSATDFFVGRADELGQLVHCWEKVLAGARGVALVAGEPGVGKTRLAAELARLAHAGGGVVLWGRCDEELAVPYQPFAEALRYWMANSPSERALEIQGLNRLVPELAEDRSRAAADVGADPEGERLLLFEGVARLLREQSEENPIVLVLDDLHWATAETLLLLRHLVRDSAPAALLIVGTFRDTDLDTSPPLADLLAGLRREERVTRLALQGLDEAGVAQFVEAASGDPLDDTGTRMATAIHRQTEGNPFFVGQVLRHLTESGAVVRDHDRWRVTKRVDQIGIPLGVREVVGRRLARLSDAANRVLTMAAVIGREFDLDTLEVLTPDHAGVAVLDLVEEAAAAHLVHEAPETTGRFTFAHALVRQTLLAELTATRRARLHRAVGEALAQQAGAPPAVVARHLCAGASPDSIAAALPWAEQAIKQAWRQTAFEEAVAIGERALAAIDSNGAGLAGARSRILVLIATSMQDSGDISRAHQLADEAIATARQAGEHVGFAEAVEARFVWARAGVPNPDATLLLTEALDGLADGAPALRARLLSTRAMYRGLSLSEGLAAEPEAREAVALAQASGDFASQYFAVFTRGQLAMGSPALDVLEEVRAGLDGLIDSAPDRAPEVDPLYRARIGLVTTLMGGDRVGAEEAILECRDIGRRTGEGRIPMALVSMWQAMLDLADGRLDSAEANAAGMLAMAASDANFNNSWASLMFRIEQERGRAAALLPVVRAAVEATPGLVSLRAVLTLALAEAGDLEQARLHLRELARNDLEAVPRDVGWSMAVSQLTEVCLMLGDRNVAAALHDHLLPFAGQMLVVAWGVYCPGAADRYVGALAGLLGRHDEADARFAAALALEERTATPALAARTCVWWARSLLDRGAAGDASRASALLDKARVTAQSLGLVALDREALALVDRLVAR